MIILPAIDIKDGNCVRLFKGDFSTVEKVAADYMETAKGFEKAGASWIHMVDLDGAKEGKPVNTKIYKDVATKTSLKVEVGGGIRNLETIEEYLAMGISRVIIGSAALKNPQLVKEAVNNIQKHSNAKNASIRVCMHPGFYLLSIADNGTKISTTDSRGIGLSNMEERVRALNGVIRFDTENGFKITIIIRR